MKQSKEDEFYNRVPIDKFININDMLLRNMESGTFLLDNINNVEWGTYGRNRSHPLIYVPITSCSTTHLEAILRTEQWIPNWLNWLIRYIIKDRKRKKDINILPEDLFKME